VAKQNVSVVVQTETATAPLLKENFADAASTALLVYIQGSADG
jgi:hypothetical protein